MSEEPAEGRHAAAPRGGSPILRAALVLNGDPPTAEEIALLDDCDVVVAADGAANVLLASGRAPTLIVGDLDSISEAARVEAERRGVSIERHPRLKDLTDGELALERLLAFQPREAWVLGAHGRRTAMFLSNLHLLRRLHEEGIDAWLLGRGERMRYVTPGRDLVLTRERDRIVSLLPVGGPAVVTETGFHWGLSRERIEAGSSRALSNLVVADEARVAVHEGVLLAVLESRSQREESPPWGSSGL